MFCAVHQLGVVVLSIHTRRGKTHPECCKKLSTVCPQPCLVMLWTSSRGTGMIPVSTLVTRVPFISHVVCFPWLLTQNMMIGSTKHRLQGPFGGNDHGADQRSGLCFDRRPATALRHVPSAGQCITLDSRNRPPCQWGCIAPRC